MLEQQMFAVTNVASPPVLEERVLLTEESEARSFVREAMDYLFGGLSLEEVNERVSLFDNSTRSYARYMGVDVRKLLASAKVVKGEDGFLPRVLSSGEKAQFAYEAECIKQRYAVDREAHGEVEFESPTHTVDYEALDACGDLELKFGNSWWRNSCYMKPFAKRSGGFSSSTRWESGIRLSVGSDFGRFTVLRDFRVGESFALDLPQVRRFKELWAEEPDRLGWVLKGKLWLACMPVQMQADPRTGKKFNKPKDGYLWAYVSSASMANKSVVKTIERMALAQRLRK
jgi:hypothetical protein